MAACLPACLLVLLPLVVVVVASGQGTRLRRGAILLACPSSTGRGVVVPSLCDHGIPSATGRARPRRRPIRRGPERLCTTLLICAAACTPATAAQAPRRTRVLGQWHKREVCSALLTRRDAAWPVEAYARRGPEDAASGTCGRKSLVARRLHSYRVPGGDRDQ